MGWHKTTHEGRVMWERNGERVFEPPSDRRTPRSSPDPIQLSAGGTLALIAFSLGVLVGALIAQAGMS